MYYRIHLPLGVWESSNVVHAPETYKITVDCNTLEFEGLTSRELTYVVERVSLGML